MNQTGNELIERTRARKEEKATGKETAEESVGELRGQALEAPPLPPPLLHALAALARRFDAKPNQSALHSLSLSLSLSLWALTSFAFKFSL
jgi:hypothetical protein